MLHRSKQVLFGNPISIFQIRTASSRPKLIVDKACVLVQRLFEQMVMIAVEIKDPPLARRKLLTHYSEWTVMAWFNHINDCTFVIILLTSSSLFAFLFRLILDLLVLSADDFLDVPDIQWILVVSVTRLGAN